MPICHLFADSISFLISSFSSIVSFGFLAQWQCLVSSANLDIVLTNIDIYKSFVCVYIYIYIYIYIYLYILGIVVVLIH